MVPWLSSRATVQTDFAGQLVPFHSARWPSANASQSKHRYRLALNIPAKPTRCSQSSSATRLRNREKISYNPATRAIYARCQGIRSLAGIAKIKPDREQRPARKSFPNRRFAIHCSNSPTFRDITWIVSVFYQSHSATIWKEQNVESLSSYRF